MGSSKTRRKITGTAVGAGCAIGPAFVFRPVEMEFTVKTGCVIADEVERLEDAVRGAHGALDEIITQVTDSPHGGAANILGSQKEFLEDPEYIGAIGTLIRDKRINAEGAVSRVCADIVNELEQLEDEYFRARAADIQDISDRLLGLLLGIERHELGEVAVPSIIVAPDLSPSDTIRLDPRMALGLCTEHGSISSHTALLASALGIPAIVGCGELDIEEDETLLINGHKREIIVNPTANEIIEIKRQIKRDKQVADEHLAAAHKEAYSADGKRCEMWANIASADDARQALKHGAEGVGLLRTEFLYYQLANLPDEGQQLELYAEIAKIISPKPLTIRTADIGGDKPLEALGGIHKDEENPFLGLRGIRLALYHRELLRTQLHALLRLSAETAVKVMIPFVSVPTEMTEVNKIVASLRDEFKENGIAITDGNFQIGAMIEIPSIAMLIDHVLEQVDFVSIGTNDFAQYIVAADRNNEQVSGLADYCNPGVLLLIERVISAARRKQKTVSICGEMAGEPLIIPLLFGMGLRNFSMSPIRIPAAKALVGTLQESECAKLVKQCTGCATSDEVRGILTEFAQSHTQ